VGLKDLGKLLTGKNAKKRIRKETGQEEPYERDYSKMGEIDAARAKAIELANKKKKEKKDKYEDGGTKFSKLKERMKGKKR
jgi:hypothetical protein